MFHALQRNIVLIVGIVLAGFICAQAAPYLTMESGAASPAALQAQSPAGAVIAVLICMALATVIGAVAGRMVNAVVGMFVIGAGMFVLDGRLDTIRAIAFANTGSSSRAPLVLLAIEAAIWAADVLGVSLAVFKIGGPLRDVQPDADGRTPHPLFSLEAMKSAGAGIIVLFAVVIIGLSPMKGQMIGATFVGGMLAGLVARLVSPHVQPVLVFASTILFGAIGYVVAMAMLKMPLDAAYVADALPALSRAMPLDYVAGALMGVAVGLGWARSFLQHEEQPVPATA